MHNELADFAERCQARAAAFGKGDELSTPESSRDHSADEVALMSILRILNRHQVSEPLTAVERSFVLGAKTMFDALGHVCDQLLHSSPDTNAAEEKAKDKASTSRSAESRQRSKVSRPTPGGGNE